MARPGSSTWGRRSVAVLLLVACVSAGAGCADESPPTGAPEATVAGRVLARVDPATDGRFVVGVLVAQTGPLAAADARVLAGIEAVVATGAGSDPSAPGGPLHLEIVDTGSDLRAATAGAGRLLDRGADVLVVGCDPDAARNAAVAAARTARVVVAPCAAAGAAATNDVLFTLGPDDDTQGRVLAEQAIGAGLVRAATVVELAPADGPRQCRAFVSRYEELGGRVVAELEQPLGVGAEVSAGNLARLEQPDVVVSCVTTSSVPVLVTTLRQLGIASPVLATTSADGAGLADPTVAYLAPVPLHPPTPSAQSLIDRGVPANGAALLGALALELVLGAAADAHGVDGLALATALRGPGTATRVDGIGFDAQQRLVLPLGLVPAIP